jgi:hypothetical protein
MADGAVNFVGQCGECSTRGSYFSATNSGGMQPGQSATVNGGPTQNCVVANDGATVFAIELQEIAGLYRYQVRVCAQGPTGIGSGYMWLAFEDSTGDVYYLKIFSSSKEWHEVSYNSESPAIRTIYWSDYEFTVDTSDVRAEKPKYKIVSPVDPVS